MNRYLTKLKMTNQWYAGLLENPQDRFKPTAAMYEAVGGKLLQYWFGVNDSSIYLLAEMKEDSPVAALAMVLSVIGAGMATSIEFTQVLTAEEAITSMKQAKTLTYRPPIKK